MPHKLRVLFNKILHYPVKLHWIVAKILANAFADRKSARRATIRVCCLARKKTAIFITKRKWSIYNRRNYVLI